MPSLIHIFFGVSLMGASILALYWVADHFTR